MGDQRAQALDHLRAAWPASSSPRPAPTARRRAAAALARFIIPNGTPGLSYGKDENKMGLRSSITSPLFFENVRLPADALLGNEGDGFKQFMQILDGGRISIGAMGLGLGQGAYEAAVQYAQRREQFGQPIANFQAIQFKLADMATELEAARLLVYKAAVLKDQRKPFARPRPWPSSSPPRSARSAPTRPSRSTAAWATRSRARSSACTATCA